MDLLLSVSRQGVSIGDIGPGMLLVIAGMSEMRMRMRMMRMRMTEMMVMRRPW